jgi:hypothetical protein
VLPGVEFELIDQSDWYDLTISYTPTDGTALAFITTANLSYALPTSFYQFIIWPIKLKKLLLQTQGYPLPKTKRLRLENEEEETEE